MSSEIAKDEADSRKERVRMNKEHSANLPKGLFSLRLWVFLLVIGGVLVLFRIYAMDTYHSSRNSIWWTERGRSLIPPTATDIKLRQDILDHYATYTISEDDLQEFLDQRFSSEHVKIDSSQERSAVSPDLIGKEVGSMGWVATEGVVVYCLSASNGGSHNYYHDPKTGKTYQTSAYW